MGISYKFDTEVEYKQFGANNIVKILFKKKIHLFFGIVYNKGRRIGKFQI